MEVGNIHILDEILKDVEIVCGEIEREKLAGTRNARQQQLLNEVPRPHPSARFHLVEFAVEVRFFFHCTLVGYFSGLGSGGIYICKPEERFNLMPILVLK